MTIQPGAVVYTQGFGSRPENVEVPHLDVRAPASSDNIYPPGKVWIDQVGNASYTLTSMSSIGGTLLAAWQGTAGGSVVVETITGGSGGALSPSSGNISILGTANQITSSGSGSTLTLSVPSSPSFGGTVTAATGFTATTGNLTLSGAASKVLINAATSSTASVGLVTLSGAATTTLTSSAITANSIIIFSLKTLGTLTASAITYTVTGGSATITPAGSTDTSVYGYLIIN